MNIFDFILLIRQSLHQNFSDIDAWFDRPAALRHYQRPQGGWTIDEILEHIALTNHYLLILIEKGARKALNLAANRTDWQLALSFYNFPQDKLKQIALPQAFHWIHPAHMEPKGLKKPEEVREQLNAQLEQCLYLLDQLRDGEGILYQTTMTVNELGKIDVYQYLYFLAQHAKRHVAQMEIVELEFRQSQKNIEC